MSIFLEFVYPIMGWLIEIVSNEIFFNIYEVILKCPILLKEYEMGLIPVYRRHVNIVVQP